MNIEYDPKVDALSIKLSDKKYEESDEVRKDVIFDYDAAGKLLRIELLNASKLFPKEFQPTKGVLKSTITQRSKLAK